MEMTVEFEHFLHVSLVFRLNFGCDVVVRGNEIIDVCLVERCS